MADEFMRKPRGIWPWLWGAWLLAFVVIEGVAMSTPSGGDTLTEQVQWVGGLAPWAFVAGFAIFIVWLTNHFVGKNSRIWRWGKTREEDQHGN